MSASALGQKRTCAVQLGMSTLPPRADMCSARGDVCFGPIADITRLFDHRIGGGEQRGRDRQSKRLGGSSIDDQLESGRPLNGKIRSLRALEDLVHINCQIAEQTRRLDAIGHEATLL